MEIDKTLLEIQSYVENANHVKEITLNRLLVDNIINNEQAKEYAEKWQIMVIKKSWFKRWTEAFGEKLKGDYIYKFVRFED